MKWFNNPVLCNSNQELMSICSSDPDVFGQIECYLFDNDEYPYIGRVDAMFNLLKSTMENSFPDFDFSWLSSRHFKIVETQEEAQANIMWAISKVSNLNKLSSKFWTDIDKEICFSKCQIYSYEPECTDSFTELGALWTMSYVFINLKMHKILHFHLREGANAVEVYHEDMELDIYNDIDLESTYGYSYA